MIRKKPGTDRGVVVSPSAKIPGAFQVTFFDARGFISDYSVGEMAQAAEDVDSMGYTEEMGGEEFDRLAMTPRFMAGVELTFLVNRERTEEEEARLLELAAIVNHTEGGQTL